MQSNLSRLTLPFLLLALVVNTQAKAEATIKIDQIIDLDALTPDQIYRFEPNFLWIQAGETLRILNSLGNHTVTSIKGIWPEGVDYVDIAHQAETVLTLTQEGIYGFRCKVHGRHGMYALVVVGSPNNNRDNIDLSSIGKRSKPTLERLIKRMDDEIAKRSH